MQAVPAVGRWTFTVLAAHLLRSLWSCAGTQHQRCTQPDAPTEHTWMPVVERKRINMHIMTPGSISVTVAVMQRAVCTCTAMQRPCNQHGHCGAVGKLLYTYFDATLCYMMVGGSAALCSLVQVTHTLACLRACGVAARVHTYKMAVGQSSCTAHMHGPWCIPPRSLFHIQCLDACTTPSARIACALTPVKVMEYIGSEN